FLDHVPAKPTLKRNLTKATVFRSRIKTQVIWARGDQVLLKYMHQIVAPTYGFDTSHSPTYLCAYARSGVTSSTYYTVNTKDDTYEARSRGLRRQYRRPCEVQLDSFLILSLCVFYLDCKKLKSLSPPAILYIYQLSRQLESSRTWFQHGPIENSAGGQLSGSWPEAVVNMHPPDPVQLATTAKSADTVPAPVGRAVSSVVQGMAQAIQLGAHLDWDFALWGPPGPKGPGTGVKDTPKMLQTLIADGVKAALTGYIWYCGKLHMDPEQIGVAACDSGNRTLSLHWRLATSTISALLPSCTICCSGCLLCSSCALCACAACPEIDPFNVVDAFKLGLDKHRREIDPSEERLQICDGEIRFRDSESTGLIW
ncbi:hypothetical protein B0H13DRAFT_2430372, partial [Mycena leptocephala]